MTKLQLLQHAFKRSNPNKYVFECGVYINTYCLKDKYIPLGKNL